MLPDDRIFSPDPAQKRLAAALYRSVESLPLICPHGHVDPRLFADEAYRFGSPAELLIIPDHYIFRMLYSQGIPLESLGIPRVDGGESEQDPRRIWQVFAENYYLFRGTPTGLWLREELHNLFGVSTPLNGNNAQEAYDQIAAALSIAQFNPRRLYEQFRIEVLCTTDAATDPLESHQAIRDSGWQGRILPTFRPDALLNLETPGWRGHLNRLEEVAGVEINGVQDFLRALESQRAAFMSMGATATDHAALTAYTGRLTKGELESIFNRALRDLATEDDARRFMGHMLMEMARMSVEDGLVMQLHVGSLRNHNALIFERFGLDKGADIPIRSEFTRDLRPLLNEFGNDSRFRLILFNLDETTYSRELAPLAGHYPAVRLGPPWWFFDSLNGMRRFLDGVVETAGIYNTAGFNDDTRAFPSIPARHNLWRRATADWVAGLVVRHIVDEDEGQAMVRALAYDLAKDAYNLGGADPLPR